MEYKTNVMRILDKNNIKYKSYSYISLNAVNGEEVAAILNKNPNQVFKTLVTIGKSGNFYIFVIPVNKELDLKAAASYADEKAVSMIKSKDLLATTGYIHGGCSPIGMKKNFQVFIDQSSNDFQTIIFSAGKIGYQVELNLNDIKKICNYKIADIVVK